MSVDCQAYIDGEVSSSQIAEVIGVLLGQKIRKDSQHGFISVDDVGHWYNGDENVYLKNTDYPEFYQIIIKENPLDDVENHFCNVHMRGKTTVIQSKSNVFWQTILTEIARFFSGYVIWSDCSDEIDEDFRARSHEQNDISSNDDNFWYYHHKLENLRPLVGLVEYEKVY